MAGFLDELFEDVLKDEPKKDEEIKESGMQPEAEKEEPAESGSKTPLFPTGSDWEQFKKEHGFGA